MTTRVAAVFLSCSLILANAFAQTTNATLGGTVSDSTGALIPGVTITATNTQTGIVNTAVTNEAGAYQFASLQNGRYNLRAELPGFQSQVRNDFDLGVSQQVRLNFMLQVGNVATVGGCKRRCGYADCDHFVFGRGGSAGVQGPGPAFNHSKRNRSCRHDGRRFVRKLRRRPNERDQRHARRRDHTDGRYAAQMGVSTTTYVSPGSG